MQVIREADLLYLPRDDHSQLPLQQIPHQRVEHRGEQLAEQPDNQLGEIEPKDFDFGDAGDSVAGDSACRPGQEPLLDLDDQRDFQGHGVHHQVDHVAEEAGQGPTQVAQQASQQTWRGNRL